MLAFVFLFLLALNTTAPKTRLYLRWAAYSKQTNKSSHCHTQLCCHRYMSDEVVFLAISIQGLNEQDSPSTIKIFSDGSWELSAIYFFTPLAICMQRGLLIPWTDHTYKYAPDISVISVDKVVFIPTGCFCEGALNQLFFNPRMSSHCIVYILSRHFGSSVSLHCCRQWCIGARSLQVADLARKK